MLFGAHFIRRAENDWMREPLSDPDVPSPSERIHRLVSAARRRLAIEESNRCILEGSEAWEHVVDGPAATLDSANAATQANTPSTPVGSAAEPCPFAAKAWIELELVGDDDGPIADEVYRIVAPGGGVFSGKTDADGVARVEGLAAGECRVSFPDLDEEAWETLQA